MALVAIVGRPNVGKSTFFNRLTETRDSIVHDQPGVTRDRVYGQALWNGVLFSIADTGGYVPNSADRFDKAVAEQVDIAIEEADAIIFLNDVITGITDLDDLVTTRLRRSKKPVFVAVNKCDNEARRLDASVFYGLGLGDPYPISSINGSGTGELLDAVVAALPNALEEKVDTRLHVAIIGRPNVGKSSLTNAILGEDRSIVTEIAGTTRDAIHTSIKYFGEEIVLVDTAGLRKRSKVHENIEFYATLRTQRAIEQCDVAVLLIDATEGLLAQDIVVLKEAESLRKGLIVIVNKWDLVEKETNTARDMERQIKERLQTMTYVPVVFVSAKTTQRVHRVLETAVRVGKDRTMRIPTSRLNEFLQEAMEAHQPPSYRGLPVKIKFVTQVRDTPPVIAFFANHPDGVLDSYKRFLENRLRSIYPFTGVPLTLVFKQK